MAFGATFQDDLLKLLLNATTIATLASNAGSATTLYLSLHTADPHAGNQTTSEAAYPGYGRVAVARTSGGWSVTGAVATLVANAVFGTSSGTPSEVETYAAVGLGNTGVAGEIIATGALSSSINVNAAGISPTLTTATTFTAI